MTHSILASNILTRDNRRAKVNDILNLSAIIQTTQIKLLLLSLLLLLLLLLLEVFGILKRGFISEKRDLEIILTNLEIIMCDLIIRNTKNLDILNLLLTLCIILKSLRFLDFLLAHLQQFQNFLIFQIG